MFGIKKTTLPEKALLQVYNTSDKAYADCYSTTIVGNVKPSDFVYAFYTTWLFKLERIILTLLVNKPSKDTHAKALANNEHEQFAAWSVEARKDDQLLMNDFQSRTRSWLMVEPCIVEGQESTRLYFGSAITKVKSKLTGKPTLGLFFYALLGFHKVYSVALLFAAKQRVKRLSTA